MAAPGPQPAAKPAAPRLDANADGAAWLQALLQATLAQVLAPASEMAEGDPAPETLHRLRVALRRLRTVLHELAPLAPGLDPAWGAALQHTFAQLGQTRDQQAVAATVLPLLQAAHAPRLQWQAAAAPAPAQAVREPAFQCALVALLGLAHAGPEHFAPYAGAQVRSLLCKRLQRLHRQVAHAGRRFERLPIEEQHRVRKRVKRLRYLIDLTSSLWPDGGRRRYLKRLGAAQAALGLHNDVAVAAEAFLHDAAVHPEAWFAAGWLQAHLAVTARGARRALVAVAEGGRFWA